MFTGFISLGISKAICTPSFMSHKFVIDWPKIYIGRKPYTLLNNSGIQQSVTQAFISFSWYKLWHYLKFICLYYTLLQRKQEI